MQLPKEEEMSFFKKAIEYYFQKKVLPIVANQAEGLCKKAKAEGDAMDDQEISPLRNLEVRAIKAGTDNEPENVRVIISYDDSKLPSSVKRQLYYSMFTQHDFSYSLKDDKIDTVAQKEFKMDIPLPRNFLKTKGIGDWTMMAMFEEFQHTNGVSNTAPREIGGKSC